MVGVKVGVEEDYSKLGHYWRDPRSDRPAFSNQIMHVCLLYFAIFLISKSRFCQGRLALKVSPAPTPHHFCKGASGFTVFLSYLHVFKLARGLREVGMCG